MSTTKKMLGVAGMVGLASLGLTGAVNAQEAAAVTTASAETQFILNTFLFLVGGFLVMFMAAGFCMLEVGLVRSKNAATICTKNIALYSISGLMFYLIGYQLMYNGVDGGFFGIPGPWAPDNSYLGAEGEFIKAESYAPASDWFFQMVFCATAASIVSGTVAERVKLWPFLAFVAVLTGIMYPITGSWQWGGGWLSEIGFSDFAGSTLVHSVGGWAALVGAIVIGARTGKFGPNGEIHPMPGSSLPLATVGTFILWLGWFGFNGGSQLAMGTAADVTAVAQIFINTNTAAAAGCVAAMAASQLLYKKLDLTFALNGALAGLVSITAEPLTPTLGSAALIGAVGGVLVVLAVPLLDKLKIDDVVGAISVHLVAGVWGTLAVPLTNTGVSFGSQLIGVLAIGAFTVTTSAIVWLALKYTVGVRASQEDEMDGLDQAELGLEAYPEFGRG
jgi:Amt family ammonium transporter